MSISIHHWSYAADKNGPIPVGWHCWVYTNEGEDFEQWMKTNCPTATTVHRFNSGNPMYQTFINCEVEATIFNLKWQ